MADTSSSGGPLREGAVVSHYRILNPVGGGGMGMVYRALDIELDRVVALKFIASSVSWSDSAGSDVARKRFISEARTASALDHPHIGTIHAIDHTDDGQMFIVMGYYEGETLRARLARGPLPPGEVNRLFSEVLSGLAKAHAAGIVHRDVKPANVIVTADGMAKVIDFGLARFHDAIRVTTTGGSVGTPGYMAPEQIEGEAVDARADVWALGALLFEMATGEAAFDGQNQAAIIHAVLTRHPERSLTGPAVAARAWAPILTRALDKDPARRYANAGEMLEAFSALQSGAPAAPKARHAQLWVAAGAAAAVLVVAYGWKRSSDRSRVRTQDVPELVQLVGQQRFAEAAVLFDRAQRVLGNDSALATMRGQIFASMLDSVVPADAHVEYREYNDTSGTWTPLVLGAGDSARVPRGAKRWRATATGFDTLLGATPRVPRTLDLTLDSAGSVPPGMVRISQGVATAWIAGVDPIEGMHLDTYFIDRYEVSNRDFKVFVDSGGYRSRKYWKFPFRSAGKTLTWPAAMAGFVDQTGQPGPSTWELGNYPRGEGNFPVSGVSWYEAAAYAEFAHKSLPTVYHWVHAASTYMPEYIVPLSNFGGKNLAPRGSYRGVSAFGLFDMAGNVREWQYNSSGQGRYALGGAWNDRSYMFTFAAVRDPLDRAPGNGFRLAMYRDGTEPVDAARHIPLERRDYSKEKPVDDAAFRLILNRFSYDPTPLNAKTESITDSAGWRHEVVSLNAAYGGDRVIAHLFLPTDRKPPFHTVVYWPGSGAIVAKRFIQNTEPFLVRSGYAYVVPIYWGTYERNAGITSTWPTQTHRYAEQVTRQMKDFRRTVDYLATRPEFDLSKLAFLGTSWGGRMGVLINGIEPRIKVAILTDGGLAAGRALPEVDQINFAPRVRIPLLMLNGKFDAIEPYETAQLPLFRMLGSPAGEKKHVVWPASHGTYPRNEAERETLAWLERFLGPVGR